MGLFVPGDLREEVRHPPAGFDGGGGFGAEGGGEKKNGNEAGKEAWMHRPDYQGCGRRWEGNSDFHAQTRNRSGTSAVSSGSGKKLARLSYMLFSQLTDRCMKRIAFSLLALAPPVLAEEPAVTYHKDIAPIIHANCTGCHRPGESGPFPLTNYAEVSRRAMTISRVVNDRYMPPWHANTEVTKFLDVRQLDPVEITMIDRWIAAGKPEGNASDAPPPPSFTEGWQLGEPDLVLTMKEAYLVPAEGRDIYRNFVLPLDLPEDKWIKAIELRPSAGTR